VLFSTVHIAQQENVSLELELELLNKASPVALEAQPVFRRQQSHLIQEL
jgi:hypothetical protein